MMDRKGPGVKTTQRPLSRTGHLGVENGCQRTHVMWWEYGS